MKVKTYTALTMGQAMEDIRRDFGPDVMILSNQRVPEGVRITIGIEEDITDEEIQTALFGSTDDCVCRQIRQSLTYHHFPDILQERIFEKMPALRNDPQECLSEAFEKVFRFMPLPSFGAKRAFMLVGPSGTGKTTAVAKMAVKARVAHKKVGVVTTDTKRAGAIEQLEAFTKILDLELIKVRKPELLKEAVDELRSFCDLTLVDTFGVNPYLDKEISFLTDLKKDITGLEPVLVLSAGLDAFEASDMAEAFLPLGCKRLMGTRLDLSRRLGSLLFAAQNNAYALCDVGISPHVHEGLCPLKADTLAELILLNKEVEQ